MKQFLVKNHQHLQRLGGGEGTQLNQAQKGAMSTKRERERGGGRYLFENADNIYCY
jgi:hypothetical protein